MKVLITGGSSGIGFELAKVLAERGDQVFSLDIQSPQANPKGVTHIKADVSNQTSLDAGLKEVGGAIDLLVNNAGVIRRGRLFDSTSEDFDLLFRVNVRGSWLMIRQARPYLAANATILQMSSGYACNPPANPAIYAWTKQTVVLLLEAIQRDYPEYQLKSTFLGPVDTPMSAVGRTEDELKEETKIMHSVQYVTGKIVQLLETDKTRLLFDEEKWDYTLAN